jgi:hypothetical protein
MVTVPSVPAPFGVFTVTVTWSLVSRPHRSVTVTLKVCVTGGATLAVALKPSGLLQLYWYGAFPPCTKACNCTGVSGQNTVMSGIACTTKGGGMGLKIVTLWAVVITPQSSVTVSVYVVVCEGATQPL